MIKAFVTDAVVSKGYNGQDALKYSEDGKSVRFRIGKKVYDLWNPEYKGLDDYMHAFLMRYQ